MKRQVLATVVSSAALYAAPAWVPKVQDCALFRSGLEKAQRSVALGVSAAYRTTSTVAAQVVAGIYPLDLLAKERCERWRGDTKEVARERLLRRWQQRWQGEEKGAWTRRLIPQLTPWIQRKEGDVNHWLTQMLSGHGAYGYLHRFGKRNSPDCPFCPAVCDTAEHTIFECMRWEALRTACWLDVGAQTPETIVQTMMSSSSSWRKVEAFVTHVIIKWCIVCFTAQSF